MLDYSIAVFKFDWINESEFSDVKNKYRNPLSSETSCKVKPLFSDERSYHTRYIFESRHTLYLKKNDSNTDIGTAGFSEVLLSLPRPDSKDTRILSLSQSVSFSSVKINLKTVSANRKNTGIRMTMYTRQNRHGTLKTFVFIFQTRRLLFEKSVSA